MANASIDRLAQLQNLIKRDPEAYIDEFRLQHRNYEAELGVLKLRTNYDSESFRQLVMFLAQVSSCYKKELANFPEELMNLLSTHAASLYGEVRRTVAQALMLLRNRGVVPPLPLLSVLFQLFRVPDKYLRELLFSHIVNDIRNINQNGGNHINTQNILIGSNSNTHGNATTLSSSSSSSSSGNNSNVNVNRSLQIFMYSMLEDDSPIAAKRSLDVMIELYRRRVWIDARTVNVIATALLSPRAKLLVTALKFFLGLTGNDETNDDDDDSSDEDNHQRKQVDKKEVDALKNQVLHVKKTRKRLRATAKHLSAMRKAKLRKGDGVPVFPAIQLLNDPQGLAEKMLGNIRRGNERFEVRLLCLNFITRLVGQHRLIVLPLYSFVQRYLSAHQQHVTQLLAYLIQACHDLVPPDELAPVIRNIANAFISDGCSSEVIQVGLNTLREIFQRCPGVLMEEGMGDLIQDLVLYRKYTNKGVVASARAILNLVREWYPALLRRRDLGKELSQDSKKASVRPTAYGATSIATTIDGADLLALALARKAQKRKEQRHENYNHDDEDEEADNTGTVEDDDDDDDDDDSVHPEDIAKLADDDEWAKVQRSKERALARVGKKVSTKTSLLAKKVKGDGEEDAADLAAVLLADDDDDDDDDHDGHSECGSDCQRHDHGDGEEDDEEEEEENDDFEGDLDDEDDGEEDDDEEEDDEDEDDDDDEEDEDDDDDKDDEDMEDDEENHDRHSHSHQHSSSSSINSSRRAALLDMVTPLLPVNNKKRNTNNKVKFDSTTTNLSSSTNPKSSGNFSLESSRILTPKDFARIKAIQEKLAEKGMEGANAQDIIRMLRGDNDGSNSSLLGGTSTLSSNTRDDYGRQKKKRRGGRHLGVVDDDGNVIEEDDEDDDTNELAMPGTSYAPPMISLDPTSIEALETSQKRKQAERLVDVLKTKQTGKKWEGNKPGGGLTNKEKDRKKNYLMLRKSSGVQLKLKSDLKAQKRAITKRLQGDTTRSWKTKMRRRRT